MTLTRPWIRHYDPWVRQQPDYPGRPLSYILDAAASAVPERVAVEFAGGTLSFAALKRDADGFAVGLRQLGIRHGDAIGVMLPNCPHYIVAVFAILRLGAVVVNINPRYTARELQLVAADAGLRALIVLESGRAVVDAVRRDSPIADVIVAGLDDGTGGDQGTGRVPGPAGRVPGPAGQVPGPAGPTQGFPSLVALGRERLEAASGMTRESALALPTAVSEDDLAVLQYTGGTTGAPRAAMLTHRNIFANVVQSVAFMYGSVEDGRAAADRYLMVIPFFHIYGFTVGMMRGVWIGATQRLVPSYRPQELLDAIREFVPGYVPAVPTIYVSLLNHPAVATSGLERVRVFNTGGAPCPVSVIERFERTVGRRLNEGYGLSESSPAISSTPQQAPRRPGTVGIPLPDTDVKIVDLDDGEPLPAGRPGELCVAGPQIMRGYWRDPEATMQALRRDAAGRVWLHTGDIATLDGDGFITIVQRKKDLIIVDALKVYPSEVEAVLTAHPAVAMAAVIGVADDYHGERVLAHVVLHREAPVTADALIAHCRTQLAPYKVPARVEIRETLPTSAVGKTLYRVLRDEAAPMAPR